MKLHTLFPFFIALMFPGVGNILADDNSGLVMAPLPPGPILPQLPDMCAWRIFFSYKNVPSSAGNAGKPKPDPGTEGLPQMVSITQTKPLWHSTIVTMDGKSIECWGTGEICYLIRGAGEKPTPLRKNYMTGNFAAGAESKYLFNPAQGGFPDMDWISQKTYVGLQQGALVFREQGSGGAEARIKADTRFPVTWQRGNEVRTFQLLPAPQDPLVLPPDVARVAAEFNRVEALINGAPPQRIVRPPGQSSTGNVPN